MDISEEHITELVVLWKEAFGVDIPVEEARSRASVVLDLLVRLTEAVPPRSDIGRDTE